MLSKIIVTIVGLLLFGVHARTGVVSSLESFEDLVEAPYGWKQGMRASSKAVLKFNLILKQPRLEEYQNLVTRISTPGDKLYGQHLSSSETRVYLEPSISALDAVYDWLVYEWKFAPHKIKRDGEWIKFTASIGQAERALDTEFYHFSSPYNDASLIRTIQYSIPANLHDTIQLVQPTTRFFNAKAQYSLISVKEQGIIPPFPQSYNPKTCNNSMTPGCLRVLYQINNFTANPYTGSTLGISGFLDQYAHYADLNRFIDIYAPYARADNFSVRSINGGLNLQDSLLDSGEANLDMQYGLSLASGVPITYYPTAGRGKLIPDLDQPDADDNQNEPYLEQLQYLLSLSDEELPSVLTTSYGEDEQSVPASYARTVCNLFAQLGGRGVSVIFSSGDTGPGSACQTNDGKNQTRFLPIFPASCPFVTSVGGTWNLEPETAAQFSSGGFSDLFPRPTYQESAVCNYLGHLGDRWEGLYNPRGRGFPDVSAQSYGFNVIDQNRTMVYSGTSAAAPVFAAIIANLNSIRMTNGLPSLGFLNPFLYSHGYRGLTDIVNGGSRGCEGFDPTSGLRTPFVPHASWNATVGWDPVTGLGTPLFPKLVELMFQYTIPANITHWTSRNKMDQVLSSDDLF